jgi:hypothetical protein
MKNDLSEKRLYKSKVIITYPESSPRLKKYKKLENITMKKRKKTEYD